jgi:hypothetical protein
VLLMALLRIKRSEALKEHAPDDLGRVPGLNRVPEVKTVRRKFERLGASGRAADFGPTLARKRVADRGAAMCFRHVDGHVRAACREDVDASDRVTGAIVPLASVQIVRVSLELRLTIQAGLEPVHRLWERPSPASRHVSKSARIST